MQKHLRLSTAAGNKKPKRSLSSYATVPGAVFAQVFLVKGQQRGKAVDVGQIKGIGEHPPKFHGKAENELQSVIAAADVCIPSPNTPLYSKKVNSRFADLVAALSP